MAKRTAPLIVGNWKMNGVLLEAMRFFKTLRAHIHNDLIGCHIVICPPATLLRDMAEKLPGTGIKLGGQDCHPESSGAFTGDISANMLRDMACDYVILGHSERRIGHNESSELVQRKATQAHEAKLTSIICVGETKYERDNQLHHDMITQQLTHSIPESSNTHNTVIAYEPVWAIGTDKTPTVKEVQDMHQHIQNTLAKMEQFETLPPIIYGGSVGEENAEDFLKCDEVQGLLLGRASLEIESFWNIILAAGK